MRKSFLIAALSIWIIGCNAVSQSNWQLQTEREYSVEWIGERPLIDRSHLSIRFDGKRRVHGFAGCNHWFAYYQLQDEQLHIDRITTTRKLCAPSLIEQERRYLETLGQTQRWDISESGQLRLWPINGAPIRLWLQDLNQ